MSWGSRAPDRLIDLAIRLAPVARRSWLESMRAELHYIPRSCRLEFAIGATKVAFIERASEMKRIASRPFDGLILLAAAFLALATINSGIRQVANDPVIATSFGALALTWSSIFIATLLGRYSFLVRMACAGCALSLAIGLAPLMLDQVSTANINLMRGLAFEGVVLFLALYCAASFAQRKVEQAH